MLQKILKQNNITNLKLFYEGIHNKTYKGFFYQEAVQVRVAKNNIVNHSNEIQLLKNQKNIIYIDDFIMIKKWIDGETLSANNLETLIKIKSVLVKHWESKAEGITSFVFDENDYYNDNEVVLSHGDLRPKNIIVDDGKDIHLIDFEWVTYTSLYFDLAHLNLYCLFSIEDIIDVFDVDKTKLEKAIISVSEFNLEWEQKRDKKNIL